MLYSSFAFPPPPIPSCLPLCFLPPPLPSLTPSPLHAAAALSEKVPSLLQQYDRLQWYWTPYTENATLLLRVPTNASITGCWSGQRLPLPGDHGTYCVDESYKALTHEGDDATVYTEMEYFVDVKDTEDVVAAFRQFQASVQSKHDPSVQLFTG